MALRPKSNEALKKALSLTARELEKTIDELERHKKAIFAIFPIHEYKKLRPDLANHFDNNDSYIINHFIHYGVEEIDIRQIQKGELAKSTMKKYLRDIINFPPPSDQRKIKEKSIHSFSKTKGTNNEIENNNDHSLAKEKCLLHYASNSICTWIPKNGCSNLRFSIALANGFVNSEKDIGWIHNGHAPLIPSNKEILCAEFSFVVLRNPFKRLLSFFLDKLCHESQDAKDTSYKSAKQTFQANENMSFMDFVNNLYSNPDIINHDQHTKAQCDYLIYNHYKKYYQFEKYEDFIRSISNEIGLKIIDTREINSIFTTKCLKYSRDFKASMPIRDIRALLEQGFKPIPDEFYTDDMVRKVGTIYFADVILYYNIFEDGRHEIIEWMNRMICDH